MNWDVVNVMCLSGCAGVIFLGAFFTLFLQKKSRWLSLTLVVAGLLMLFASFARNAALTQAASAQETYTLSDRESDMFREAGIGLVWLVTVMVALDNQRRKTASSPSPHVVFTQRIMLTLWVLLALVHFVRAYDTYRDLQHLNVSIGVFP